MSRLDQIWGESLSQGKIAHAYLLVGEGADDVAHQFIAKLYCDDLCGQCSQCVKLGHGTHPDVKWIERDGKRIKIDQIRALQLDARYPPLEATKKIYVVQDIEDFSFQAANALLKILEDPPKFVVFLLTSTSVRVLPTILSRCQVLRLNPGSLEEQEEALRTRGLSDEEIEYAANIIRGLAHRFDRLISILENDHGLLDSRDKVQAEIAEKSHLELLESYEESEDIIGEREVGLALLGSINYMKVYEIFEIAQVMSKWPEEKNERFLEEALRWYRDLLLVQEGNENGADGRLMVLNGDRLDALRELANSHNGEQVSQNVSQIVRLLANGKEILAGNANLQLFYESLMLRLVE
jgi:DNA polymerase-3 subunit delta'